MILISKSKYFKRGSHVLTDVQTLISTSSWYQGREWIFQQRKHVYLWPAERLCISDLDKATVIQHLPTFRVGQALLADPQEPQLLGGLTVREKPCRFVHLAEHPGGGLFHSGLWIMGSTIQALESHAGLLPKPWSLFLIFIDLCPSAEWGEWTGFGLVTGYC